MRVLVLSLAAALGLGIGTISAVAAAGHHSARDQVSHYDLASTNVDLAQAKLGDGDVASARAHIDAAMVSAAACDADAKCKARTDNFNLHARLEQTARRVALWEKQ